MLLAMKVGGDRPIFMHELTIVVVKVDGFAGLVRREELEGGEPELVHRLILSEDHVGDVFIDGGVKDVRMVYSLAVHTESVGAAAIVPSM
jgi:hypothetical protein